MRSTNRKGIYQAFDAAGNVIADERWQAIRLSSSGVQIDNETVRIAPFSEPRSDAMTIQLDDRLRLLEFSIHGLRGMREGRICVLGEMRDRATLCWRCRAEIHERPVHWHDDIEILWNTPLCHMVVVWRSRLEPGQTRTFNAFLLDAVTFRPSEVQLTYQRRPDAIHPTRFGERNLQHYHVLNGQSSSQFWCDDDGVIYDYLAADGSGCQLTAVNIH